MIAGLACNIQNRGAGHPPRSQETESLTPQLQMPESKATWERLPRKLAGLYLSSSLSRESFHFYGVLSVKSKDARFVRSAQTD